ncbi:MAG: FAD-dependent oxidoreductase, partial [Dehalococcoidia bacterium]|nr:FAD-dependent oxidoreductase [Dehalococcoidia bacterium]
MRVCIVGGGGGASNAANVIRRLNEEAQIDIFTDRAEIGNQPCEIPFVLKGDLPSWNDTFVFTRKFYDQRNVTVHLNNEVTEIIRSEKRLIAGAESYSYDKLILDLGAIPTIPPVPGIDGQNEFVLTTNLKAARVFQEAIPQHSTAAIIGTGQIALEVAAVLKANNYERICLLGRSESLLRAYLDKDMAERVEARVRDNGVDLILSARIRSITSQNGKKILSLPDQELKVDFVFFATGSRPNVGLAQKAGLEIGETGGILVDEYLQTSDPDIYAIGDCTENWDAISGWKRLYQTATSAARGGRIAANNLVRGNVLPYQGTTMPFIMEAFGYQVGTVGFTESYARERDLDVLSNIMTTATRRRAFGGKTIHIKLVASRKTRTLVGAQIVSEEMVAGKIDRLAVAIAARVPVERLAVIDTCYSPTVGTAYEPLIMALDE